MSDDQQPAAEPGEDITTYTPEQLAAAAVAAARDGFVAGVEQMTRELARRARHNEP